MNDCQYISLNGKLVDKEQASVSPMNRAMMYGDGCFETLKCYYGEFLDWESHYNRLSAGLSYLLLELPEDSGDLKSEIISVLDANNLMAEEAMVRIQYWREGGRGYSCTSKKASYMIQAHSYDMPQDPLHLITAKTRCIPSESLERSYKLTNGLNYIKAAQEADRQQKDDSLMLTVDGYVSETTIANIFWLKDGVFYTPSVSCDLLPGITRGIILKLLQDNKLEVTESEFKPDSFYEADSAFCTNSLIEIREVGSIDGKDFKMGNEAMAQIKEFFQDYKERALKE